MFDRLDQLEARYDELGRQLSEPAIVNDQENYRKVSKAYRDIEPDRKSSRSSKRVPQGSRTALPRLR